MAEELLIKAEDVSSSEEEGFVLISDERHIDATKPEVEIQR